MAKKKKEKKRKEKKNLEKTVSDVERLEVFASQEHLRSLKPHQVELNKV